MDILSPSFLSCLISPSLSAFNISSVVAQPIMYTFSPLLLLGSLAVQAVLAFPDPSRVKAREAAIMKRSVESFLATETPIALADLLCNIGSAGTCVPGTDSGIVVASPDSTNPNCTAALRHPRQVLFKPAQLITSCRLFLLDA
jgi:glucoamylase